MMQFSKIQVKTISQSLRDNFLKSMIESIRNNLGLEELPSTKELDEIVVRAEKSFNIRQEEQIEDYLLLYYNFSVMRKIPLPGEINNILSSKTKPEKMKINQLTKRLILSYSK